MYHTEDENLLRLAKKLKRESTELYLYTGGRNVHTGRTAFPGTGCWKV